METTAKEDGLGPFWVSSTNWPVTGGSLDGSITLVTSSSTEEEADAIPSGVLLERPPESPPCEITIFFREKHEIHSIYVRSTAKIYEVYYSSCEAGSNEYLCTVRCGAAVSESINEVLPKSDNSNSKDDDWVEIKVPDSLLQENRLLALSNVSNISEIQYEATAEISDSSPCMSVTLRLLSHQIKTYIHIDEIYIYADRIEDNNQDPPVCNVGMGSLVSMLVPGLLDLSKSGGFQFSGQGRSGAIAGSKFSSSSDLAIDSSFRDMSISEEATSSRLENFKVGPDPYHVSELKIDGTNGTHDCNENALEEPIGKHSQSKSAFVEKGADQLQTAKCIEMNDSYVRLEMILDDLVSRVKRVENFCSSFQESIIKPLAGIDIRLQRMEGQIDSFSKAALLSSETVPSSSLSFNSDHTSNLKNNGCMPLSAVTEPSSHDKEEDINTLTVFLPQSLNTSDLAVKASEFPDDVVDDGVDDDVVDDDVDDSVSNVNFMDATTKEYPQKDSPLSIDKVLASELTAFMSSATDRSCLLNSCPVGLPNEQQIIDNQFIDSDYGAVLSVVEWVLEDKNCCMTNKSQDKTSQSDKYCNDPLYPINQSKNIDTFDTDDTKPQHYCLCNKSLVLCDDSSHLQESKSLIIREPEFSYEDDTLNCIKSSYSHISDHSDTRSLELSDRGSYSSLALFLSSGSSGSSNDCSNFHAVPFELSSDDIFNESKVHLEASESVDMDSCTGVGSAIGQNSEIPETVDVIHQVNPRYELEHVSSFIPDQDDFTSNIKFNADKSVRSWLPLEILLCEKSDGNVHNGEDLAGSSEFHASRSFINEYPSEVLDEKLIDHIESSDYFKDAGTDQQFSPCLQKNEIFDNALLDKTYIHRSEFYSLGSVGISIDPFMQHADHLQETIERYPLPILQLW